jgi:hypothetical protein
VLLPIWQHTTSYAKRNSDRNRNNRLHKSSMHLSGSCRRSVEAMSKPVVCMAATGVHSASFCDFLIPDVIPLTFLAPGSA